MGATIAPLPTTDSGARSSRAQPDRLAFETLTGAGERDGGLRRSRVWGTESNFPGRDKRGHVTGAACVRRPNGDHPTRLIGAQPRLPADVV